MTQKEAKRSTLERVDTLTEPPVMGRFYLVRCVLHTGYKVWYPVLGPVHSDPEILGKGDAPHVHFDFRFMSDAMLDDHFHGDPETNPTILGQIFVKLDPKLGAGQFAVKRRRCYRSKLPTVPTERTNPVTKQKRPISATLVAERACSGLSMNTWTMVCPHRGVPLGSQPIDAGGCVTCPGHGIRWHATTGELVTRYGHLTDYQREQVLADHREKSGGAT